MKRVFLVRHGQTDYNLRGIVQGSGVNASLNATGKQQALAFYQNFRGIPFDKVYTSKLRRTSESVASFIDFTPHEEFEELNEISWGIFEGKEVDHRDRAELTQLVSDWRIGNLHRAPINGESPIEVAERQKRFLPVIIDRTHEQNILICSHGRAMRIFLCVLLGLSLNEMDKFPHQNLCLYELGLNKSKKFELLRENYIGHLLQA